MKIKIIGQTVHISVPTERNHDAPTLLQKIWREEFAGQTCFWLEMTETVRLFVEEAKLNRHILVYR